MHTFGELLRHLRQRARMTQDELGIAVGYSRAHIARLESNQRLPDPSAVRARFFEPLDLKPNSPEALQLLALASAAHDSGGAEETEPERQTPNNLPFPVTSFVGRTEALAEVQRLLATTRLLTLTGVGGTGKTRLALELASRVLDDFPDGIWLVELAAVEDSGRVPSAILASLGLREPPEAEAADAVLTHFRDKTALLLLDNCEHLIDAAATLVQAWLKTCGRLTVIATSRESLNIAGELAWRVPSLASPDARLTYSRIDLLRFESVQLFMQRAAFAHPGFALSDSNASAIQKICSRLDGIPLAIELAAARIKTFTPEQIAERLNNRFALLTGGNRGALPRQQTLQALIDWSYRLLTDSEQRLLRRLSVFSGGWTLEAAEAVTTCDQVGSHDIADLLGRLVDKSLVVIDQTAALPRYRFLETIRVYAQDKLTDADETARFKHQHLSYFAKLAQRLGVKLSGGQYNANHLQLVGVLEAELDNIRTALEWARFTSQVDEGSRLACGFAMLFVVRGRQHELLTRLRHLLDGVNTLPPKPDIAQAYNWLTDLQIRQGDWAAAEAAARIALEIGMTLADPEIQSRAAWHLSSCTLNQGRFDEAHAWTEHALTLGKFDPGTAIQIRLNFSTFVGLYQGDYANAAKSGREMYERVTSEVSASKVQTSGVARLVGYALAHTGDLHEAYERMHESLVDNHALGDELAVTASLSAFATLANAQGNPKRAVILLSASEVLRLPLHAMLLPIDTLMAKRAAAVARDSLTDDEWQISWAAGQTMNLTEAMAFALQA